MLSALARRAARLELTAEPVSKPNNSMKSYAHLPLHVTAETRGGSR